MSLRIPCFSHNASNASVILDTLLIGVVFAMLFAFGLGGYPLQVPDEARYVEIAREMLSHGDFITPTMNGWWYFEKPAFFYWLQALAIAVGGLNEAALRAWPACFATIGVLTTYWLGCRCFDRKTGLLAAAMLGSSLMYFIMAHAITLDMPVAVLLTVSLAAFLGYAKSLRPSVGWLYLSFVAAALAVLTKGLIGIAFPALIIPVWLLLTRRWRLVCTWHLLAGIGLFFLVAVPWHLLAQLQHHEFFQFYIIEQHILRYLTDSAQRTQPWWFFGPVLLLGFFPWTLLLPRICKSGVKYLGSSTLYLFIWFTTVVLFFSVSKSKLVPYILPAFPPLALLVAHGIRQLVQNGNHRINAWPGTVLCSSILLLGIGLFAITAPHLSANWRLQAASPELRLIGSGFVTSSLVLWLLWRTKARFYAMLAVLGLAQMQLVGWFMVAWPNLEDRSIKPLAETYLALAGSKAVPVMYRGFYYDLPVYLNQTIMSVTPIRGELRWGAKRAAKDSRAAESLLSEKEFKSLWQEQPGLYVFSDLDDDGTSPCNSLPHCELLAKTNRYVLYRNRHPEA